MTAPRRHRWLLVCLVLVLVCLIWPVYAIIPAINPIIFGLPFSFAWLVFCISVTFLALLITFRIDMREAQKQGRGDGYTD